MSTRIISGASGAAKRYHYKHRADKPLWLAIEGVLKVGSPADRRRVHRAVRKAINWHHGWRTIWDGARYRRETGQTEPPEKEKDVNGGGKLVQGAA